MIQVPVGGLLQATHWARRSVGRSLPWHGRGPEFKSRRVHSNQIQLYLWTLWHSHIAMLSAQPQRVHLNEFRCVFDMATLPQICSFILANLLARRVHSWNQKELGAVVPFGKRTTTQYLQRYASAYDH